MTKAFVSFVVVAGGFFLLPILYLFATGPLLGITCMGWMAISGHPHEEVVNRCLALTELFQ